MILRLSVGHIPPDGPPSGACFCPRGPSSAGSSPARASLARGPASRRAGLPRAPGWGGIRAGAPTQPSSPLCVRSRERQEPQGPAVAATSSGVAGEGLVRRSGALSPWRVPRLPRSRPSASGSWAREASALASWWTSRPTESGREGRLADRRGRGGSCLGSCPRRLWRLARSPAW